MIFRTCPVCGAALDPGERCDCQAAADRKEDDTNEQAQEIRKSPRFQNGI